MFDEQQVLDASKWFDQAVEDLFAAHVLRRSDRFAQACFYSQQAAEKALMASARLVGSDASGHSTLSLARDLARYGLVLDLDEAQLASLDRLYDDTRYPSHTPDTIPQKAFGPNEAENAVYSAKRVVQIIFEKIRVCTHVGRP